MVHAGQSGVKTVAEVTHLSLLQDVQTVSGAHQPPMQWVQGFFPRDNVTEPYSLSVNSI